MNGIKDPPTRVCKEPNIIKNYLTEDNWAILTEYLAILKPLWIAIKQLKGRLKEGTLKTFFISITNWLI